MSDDIKKYLPVRHHSETLPGATGSTQDQSIEEEESEYRDETPQIDRKLALRVMEKANEDGSLRKVMKARKSAFVANIIHLNGKKFDFTGRNYLMPIYDSPDKQILLKTARQVEKTTFLGNNLTINSVIQPYNKSLYVSPSHTQTRQFSNEKLKPAIEGSPLIKRYFQDSSISTQVFEKGFTNGAYIFLRSAFRSADRTRGISASDLCYDKNAFVLTRSGWKSVTEISINDEIADVNDKGAVEWNKPSRVIRKNHTGSMITFSHAGFHIRVTDDHNMWANFRVKNSPLYKREDKYEFVKASDLLKDKSMGFKMTCKAEWPTSSHDDVSINGLVLPYLGFCYLLGWYIAEGSISKDYPVLNISSKDLKYLKPLLDNLGVNYSVYNSYRDESSPGKSLWIFHKELGRYFKKLGTSYYKHIPREFMNDPEGLKYILKGVYLGDACYHKGEKWVNGTLRTRSRQLALDVQEAWLRLRRPAVIHIRMSPNKALNLTPGVDYEMVPLYEVCSYNRNYMIFWKSQREERISEERVENEEVYCFTVKNHRPIVKGDFESKPVISGNCLDEIQDMLISEIPVIKECTSHFEDATIMMAGTPKSLDNPIEVYWKGTTQNEWLTKCTSCNHWNFLDETNIADTEIYINKDLPPGPVCKKCGKPIDPATGQWFSFAKGKMIQGYRIPQLMVPWIIQTYEQWMKLLWKRDNYPLGQFYNEVLGISYDNASKPITRDQLLGCCDPGLSNLSDNPTPQQVSAARKHILSAGIDWGEGNDGSELSPTGKKKNASYTVFTIGYYVDQRRFKYIYMKKFTGKETDPEYIVKFVARMCKLLGVKLVGVDWGHGWGVNNHLVRLLGADTVVQYQYLPKQKDRMKWDPIGFKYQLLRNLIISEFFHSLKHDEIIFPKWADFEYFSKDILAVYTEYVEYTREMKYDHRQSDPDDFLHSAIYCKMAGDLVTGRRYGAAPTGAGWGGPGYTR